MGAAAPAEITAEQLVQRARALRPELVRQQAETVEPSVRATRENGGHRLEGAVAYCSGIPYSTYFMGQAMPPETRSASTAPSSPRTLSWRTST
jgi:hypothetical protein